MNERELGRLVELRRRIDNLLRVGQVARSGHGPRPRAGALRGRCRRANGLEAQTDWIPWLTQRAGADRTWWAPSVGEQVLVLAPQGDLASAVALPAVYQQSAAPPAQDPAQRVTAYRDGAVVRYDTEGHVVTLELPAAGRVKVTVGRTTLAIEDAGMTLSTPSGRQDWGT